MIAAQQRANDADRHVIAVCEHAETFLKNQEIPGPDPDPPTPGVATPRESEKDDQTTDRDFHQNSTSMQPPSGGGVVR